MKKFTPTVWIIIGLLTIILVLTLIPLCLMFYTSLKPVGTLTQPAREIVIADFNKGETNSLGDLISTRAVPPSSISSHFQKLPDPFWNRVGEIRFRKEEGVPCAWLTRIGQDMRKFSYLQFYVKGDKGAESFTIDFTDTSGNKTSVHIKDYLSVSDQWQRIVIPINDFNLKPLSPGRPTRLAEDLSISFDQPGSGRIYIDNISLHLRRFTLNNFVDVLISGPFGRYFLNSCLIAILVTAGNMLFSSMAGYALARKVFTGRKTITFLVIVSIVIPPQILMVPMFLLMRTLGWLNTYKALIIPALVGPFNIFLMRQYISKLPLSLEDAARIDGASDFQIFFKVIMPLAKPALAVVGINTFMGCWNAFLYPFILTNTSLMRTLPVGLALYKGFHGVDWVHLMAGATITAIPVVIVFLLFQRQIITALSARP